MATSSAGVSAEGPVGQGTHRIGVRAQKQLITRQGRPAVKLLLGFYAQGLIVGFSIAAPVGPIGLLCIQRSLTRGRGAGLVSGLGAATADAMYGSVAGFGVSFVSTFLVSQQSWIRLVGGAFLIYLGAKIWRSKPRDAGTVEADHGLLGDYASTLALTLSNPLTIISFAAIFSGLGLAGAGGDYVAAAALVSGVFSGSTLWWVILSTAVSSFRKRLEQGAMRWVDRVSGTVILAFGSVAILSILA